MFCVITVSFRLFLFFWYEGLSKGLKKKLQIMQNKVIRFIKGYTPRTSISFQDYVDLTM